MLPEELSDGLEGSVAASQRAGEECLAGGAPAVLSVDQSIGHCDRCGHWAIVGQQFAHDALGLFLNTIPFRQRLTGGTWTELIRQVFKPARILPFQLSAETDAGGKPESNRI